MHWNAAISDMEYRVALARAYGPKDILTTAARAIILGANVVLTVVLLPVELATTAIGGCLIVLTLGVFSILLNVIWLPFLGLLLGTSWLWLRAWYLRPLLIIPGALLAIVADVFMILAPGPEKDAKHAKLCIAQEWPLSWYLVRPPSAYFDSQFVNTPED